MQNDTYKVYKLGDTYKVVYFKIGKRRKDKTRFDTLADWYEDNITAKKDPNDLDKYERGYDYSEARKRKKEMLSADVRPLTDEEEKERFTQSLSRSRRNVFELAMCNEFTYFCTFTLDGEKRDRFDLKAFVKSFTMFIRNYNRNRSEPEKLRYLLIPEKHKDGAYHAHGLFMGFTESDFTRNEFGYLDWSAYRERFGFFNCSPIRDRHKTASYISKYICKDFSKGVVDSGCHTFYASQGLKRREDVTYLYPDCDFKETVWDWENDFVQIKTFTACEFGL